jgi:hypothetical protein
MVSVPVLQGVQKVVGELAHRWGFYRARPSQVDVTGG